ncbi:MAG TPA: LysM peptidoglycan-binding domain-containing protein [Chitinophagaceae bacterium]
MHKYILSLLFLFCSGYFVYAQQGSLLIKTSDKGLYLEHKVAAKENFYSIGRLYNAHPRYIASYNRLDINKGMAIGQLIRIPLSDTNFTQKGNKGTPVYYKVGENEGLMKVSSLHKNVTLENLRDWNDLPNNVVHSGNKLVVGFLVSKEMPAVTLTPKAPKEVVEIAAEKKPEPKKEEPVKTEPVVVKKEEIKQPEKEEKKEIKNEEVKAEPAVVKQQVNVPVSENGYFKYYFDQQVKQSPVKKEETVTSGIFKTTSGWLDSKYYLLIDGVQPGTIVRIINPSNNKVIYAKVLGEMSGIKQNEGLTIRLSTAGASALQVTEQDKFIVKVNY